MREFDRFVAWNQAAHKHGRFDVEELRGRRFYAIDAAQHSPEGIETLSALPKLSELAVWGDYDDADLLGLAKLKMITKLTLHTPRVTPRLFETAVVGWKKLSAVRFQKAKLKGPGLGGLSHNRKLKSIEIWHESKADGAAIADLSRVSHLRRLDLSFSHVSGSAVAQAGECHDLRELVFPASATPTDEDLRQLHAMKRLERVQLSARKLTDAGIESLSRLVTLKCLTIHDATGITDQGLAHLGALPVLRELQISGLGPFTGAFLEKLPALALQNLFLSYTGFRDAHMHALARFTNLRQLALTHTKVGDSAIGELGSLTKLEGLDLRGTNVTEAGLFSLGLPLAERVSIDGDSKGKAMARLRAKLSGPTARDFLVLRSCGTLDHAHFDTDPIAAHGDVEQFRDIIRRVFERSVDGIEVQPGLEQEVLVFRESKLVRRIDLQSRLRIHPLKADGSLGRGLVVSRLLDSQVKCAAVRQRIESGEHFEYRVRWSDLPVGNPLSNPLQDGEEAEVVDWREWDDGDCETGPRVIRVRNS